MENNNEQKVMPNENGDISGVEMTPPENYVSSAAEVIPTESETSVEKESGTVPLPADPSVYESLRTEQPKTDVQPVGVPLQYGVAGEGNYYPAIHNVTPINPELTVKKSGKGLRIFALILAFVLVLTLGAGAGFIVGKEYKSGLISSPDVELAEKPTDRDEYTVESVYEVVKKSVVRIVIYSSESETYSNASGVVYSKDGYIVTNDHIYSKIPNAQFLVQTWDGKEYEARFVAGDTRSDLAVLKVDANNLVAAEFGNSEQLDLGETAVAVGYPDGATCSVVTCGVISALDVWVTGTTSYSTRLIQTDAALNPGSSGGALSNGYGQVVGITVSKSIEENVDLVNYAIPTTTVKRVVESLISNGYVTGRSRLGITYNEIGDVESILSGLPTGLYLQDVSDNKELTKAGVQKGDVITHFDGKEITGSTVVLSILENTPAGSKVTLTVYRADTGISTDIEVTLMEYKGNSSYTTEKSSSDSDKSFDFPFGD